MKTDGYSKECTVLNAALVRRGTLRFPEKQSARHHNSSAAYAETQGHRGTWSRFGVGLGNVF